MPATLVAKWQIVNDSMIYHNTPEGSTTNYRGKPGDYFDFRTDGKLYIKETDTYDTLTYKMLTDTTAIIENFGINSIQSASYHSVINPLAYHNATITSPDFLFPGTGGGSHRIINLKK
jgi:hypothetical protein